MLSTEIKPSDGLTLMAARIAVWYSENDYPLYQPLTEVRTGMCDDPSFMADYQDNPHLAHCHTDTGVICMLPASFGYGPAEAKVILVHEVAHLVVRGTDTDAHPREFGWAFDDAVWGLGLVDARVSLNEQVAEDALAWYGW